MEQARISLAVQWLGLCTFTAEGPGSTPAWGTKILQAAWTGQKKKKKKTHNTSKDLLYITGNSTQYSNGLYSKTI